MSTQDTTTLTLHDAAVRILEEKNISIDDAEIREEMIDDIEQSISDRISVMMIQALAHDKKIEFDQLIDAGGSPEMVQEFLSANITNIPDIVASAIVEVRNIYLSN